MIARSTSPQIVERALALSKGDGAVVIANESSSVNLRWANNTLTTNGASRDRSVTVVSFVGRSFGVRSTSLVAEAGEAALEELVRAAEADARQAGDAEDYAELVGPADAAAPGPGAFTDPAEPTTTAVFAQFARDLGDAFGRARADGRLLYGFAEHGTTTTWLGTSTGVRLRHTQPLGSVEFTAKNGRPGGSVWHGQATRDFTDVSVADADALLARRLAWTERQVELPAGRYETLLPGSAVADLMLDAYWSAGGRDAVEGRTVFSKPGGTRLGEALGPAGFQMYSDPFDPVLATEPFVAAAFSSATSSVFDNGLGLARTSWIEDGKLANLIHTRASARRASATATPFVDNLIIDGGGSASLEEMIASTERGLLLTCLWYIREVDPKVLLLTGLTRDGVYLVEGGEIVGAVNNFRFNESPVDMLGRCAEVGATGTAMPREWADYFQLVRMPALRIDGFNMSSVSPAS